MVVFFCRLLLLQFAGGCTALLECKHVYIYFKYLNITVRSDKRRGGVTGG